MKKISKKGKAFGFTLTELVIVIVIIAILAAVLIPAYSGYVQRAKDSNDTSLVKYLNDALLNTENDSNYKHDNLSDVISILEEYGFKLAALQAKSSDNTLVWNQDTNRFYIINNGEVESRDNNSIPTGEANASYKYWIIYTKNIEGVANITSDETDANKGIVNSEYSLYLNTTLAYTTLDISSGIDLVENKDVTTINYVSNDTKDVHIISNSFSETLNINASNDTISHWGKIGYINSTAMKAYYEYGECLYLANTNGKVVVEKGGKINLIVSSDAEATVENNGGTIGKNINTSDGTNLTDSEKDEQQLYIDVATLPVTTDGLTIDSNGTLTAIDLTKMTPDENGQYKIKLPNTVKSISKNISNATLSNKNTTISEIIIPDSVTSIEEYAFAYCDNLKSLYVGDGVITIGQDAFSTCTNLTNCYLGKNLDTIENYAFQNCQNLKSIELPESVTTIGRWTFKFSGLTSINIPKNLQSIGDVAFGECLNLVNITVDSDNDYFSADGKALYNKDKTKILQYAIGLSDTNFEIPNTVTEIGNYAFYYCRNLTGVTLPNNLEIINEHAFMSCSKLENIEFPKTLKRIEENAFLGCLSLTSIIIPENVIYVGSWAFSDCSSLTSAIVNANIDTLNSNIFKGCSSLPNFKVPNGIKSINYMALWDLKTCSYIYIPKTVNSFAKNLFGFTRNSTLTENSNITILYEGTEADWNLISKTSGWNTNATLTIKYNVAEDNYDKLINSEITVDQL